MSRPLSLSHMRFIATGALVSCVIGMFICRLLEPSHAWLAWPRAFFEAGTVGALADWFAVVALFRHPMGLPLKHTAILPNNKERVAASLADFLETSFLTEQQLGPKFRDLDYAGFAARWLEANTALLADKAVAFVPDVIAGLSDEEMTTLLAERARHLIREAEVGPMVGAGLEVIVQNGRDREIFVSVLKGSHTLLGEHRGTIQDKIRQEIPLSGEMLRNIPIGRELVGPVLDQLRDALASAIAAKTIEKVQATLDEAAGAESSPLWRSFDTRMRQFIADLKASPEMAEKIRTMQDSLAASGVVDDFARKTWGEIKHYLLDDCAMPDSVIRSKIVGAIQTVARQLGEKPELRAEINVFFGAQVVAAVLAARPHARELVVATITAWNMDEMSEKLEATVGRDLQFIRLNGTLVGGAIGVLIHLVFVVLGR